MHRILKHGIRSVVRALGYDLMPLRDLKERDLSIHLAMLFDRLAIDCVLDVGANVGQYRDFLREKVLYSGPIVSFEPVARNVATLRDRARHDRKWHVEGYALGAETRTTKINVMRSDQFSSFLEPDNARVPSFTGLNAVADTELVSLQTLDSVLPRLRSRLGFKRPYLKLDTQGYDLEAIRGCEAELPSIQALQTEASIISIYKNMPAYFETIRDLNGRGFDVTGFYPVSRDDSLRLVEFDCVMVNRAVVAPRATASAGVKQRLAG